MKGSRSSLTSQIQYISICNVHAFESVECNRSFSPKSRDKIYVRPTLDHPRQERKRKCFLVLYLLFPLVISSVSSSCQGKGCNFSFDFTRRKERKERKEKKEEPNGKPASKAWERINDKSSKSTVNLSIVISWLLEGFDVKVQKEKLSLPSWVLVLKSCTLYTAHCEAHLFVNVFTSIIR